MPDNLSYLILTLTLGDGSTIGDGALMALLREQVSDLTDEDYAAARDALVDEGIFGRGKGGGGSIYGRTGGDPDGDEADDDFELTAPEGPDDRPDAARQRKARKVKTVPRWSGEPVPVLSYRHGETRVNNPEVGMIRPHSSQQTLEIAHAADLTVIPTGQTKDDLRPAVKLAHSQADYPTTRKGVLGWIRIRVRGSRRISGSSF